MIEINWWVWVGLWLVAWLWQNAAHELSHLWTGWIWEGRKPVKFIPVMHFYQKRWYWSRYESGPATKADVAQHEDRRHSAPLRWASIQVGIVWFTAGVILFVSGLGVFGAELESVLRWIVVYSVPFMVCPVVDMLVWIWGYWARRPGTDGDRWRQALERW
jgi:hypothetical protein